jgi:signal transduction histidine kinase
MSEAADNVTLSEIVAVMVHDLNNPLAALGTNLRFLENMLGTVQSKDVTETLSDAHMLCDILRRVVSNLGMLGQSNPLMARPLTLDVVTIATSAVQRLKSQAEAAEVTLVFDAALRTGEVFVESDPGLCERALDNLLAFAIERAVSRSSILVSAMKSDRIGVLVQFTARPNTTEISAHPSRSRQLQSAFGRGLSLHCARIAAEATRGRIDVRRDDRDQMALELVLHTDDKQIA